MLNNDFGHELSPMSFSTRLYQIPTQPVICNRGARTQDISLLMRLVFMRLAGESEILRGCSPTCWTVAPWALFLAKITDRQYRGSASPGLSQPIAGIAKCVARLESADRWYRGSAFSGLSQLTEARISKEKQGKARKSMEKQGKAMKSKEKQWKKPMNFNNK